MDKVFLYMTIILVILLLTCGAGLKCTVGVLSLRVMGAAWLSQGVAWFCWKRVGLF
jgi:hypothetical protein